MNVKSRTLSDLTDRISNAAEFSADERAYVLQMLSERDKYREAMHRIYLLASVGRDETSTMTALRVVIDEIVSTLKDALLTDHEASP